MDDRPDDGRTVSDRQAAARNPENAARDPRSEPRQPVVAVTGAASGIGAAVRARLERAGARVVGVDLAGTEVEADLADAAGRTHAVAAVAEVAGGRLDCAVACAGLGPHVRPYSRIAQVNYFGMVALLDGFLPLLRQGREPAAVAISSNSAGLIPGDEALLAALAADDERGASQIADSLDGALVYGTTKRAIVRAVRGRARAWGDAGVRLNAVAPGPVETALLAASRSDPVLGPLVDALPIPLRRRSTPDEIAGVIEFLLGGAAAYVHGTVFFVDGGTDAELRPDAL
jgi:3alpha-hydroxysteroid 3-dehydrogenase